jgi:hypothetical protein
MILAYFLLANLESSSLLAPVTTILPLAKIKAVVLGSLILMMTAAKRFLEGQPTHRSAPLLLKPERRTGDGTESGNPRPMLGRGGGQGK